ncbi:hypothetical protein PILCRDRAFT_439159 [Piloderma croceum F 1598]|uniref:Uncharacterized protein n=1 Tax=Piloderma croceum (strain F 1598) TaxID=765440 RepID=A0A0C3FFU8_PILCF|nr:hypothetical protein PILCRDRAFT_439159 [Piloderma croceum F 1598]
MKVQKLDGRPLPCNQPVTDCFRRQALGANILRGGLRFASSLSFLLVRAYFLGRQLSPSKDYSGHVRSFYACLS